MGSGNSKQVKSKKGKRKEERRSSINEAWGKLFTKKSNF